MALAPDRSEAYGARASVRYEAGRLDEAAEDLDRALQLDPRNAAAPVLSAKGYAAMKSGSAVTVAVLRCVARGAAIAPAAIAKVLSDRAMRVVAGQLTDGQQVRQALVAAYPDVDPARFEEVKQLTLGGYYSSEVGMTQEQVYLPVPGRYDGALSGGDRVEDVVGHTADVTLLQPRVPLRAHAGKDGEFGGF